MNLPTCLVTIISCLCLCCSAQSEVTAKTPSRNLIFEGNFAEQNNGIPAGWVLGGYAGGTHGNTAKVTEDSDGNYVTLSIKKKESSNFVLNLAEPVIIKPTWKKLICSVDIRVFNYVQGSESYHKPRMHISFLDETGQEISNVGVSLPGRYTDAWQTAERIIPIPATATTARLWIGTLSSIGDIEFRSPYVAPVE